MVVVVVVVEIFKEHKSLFFLNLFVVLRYYKSLRVTSVKLLSCYKVLFTSSCLRMIGYRSIDLISLILCDHFQPPPGFPAVILLVVASVLMMT